jgi:hypothetical protein
LREAIPSDHRYHFLIYDGDTILSSQLDESITHMGLRVLNTPSQSPQGEGLCERVIGTLRRECVRFFIPLTEKHLVLVTTSWVAHYNRGCPMPASGLASRARQMVFLSAPKEVGTAASPMDVSVFLGIPDRIVRDDRVFFVDGDV